MSHPLAHLGDLVKGTVALAMVVAGVFWFRYGTLDPCDALAERAVLGMENPLAAAAAPLLLRGMIASAELGTGQCLEGLWKFETGRFDPPATAR